MAYPEEHRLLTFGGPLGDLGEQWSMSLRTDSDWVTTGDETEETEQAKCASLAAVISASFTDDLGCIGSQAKIAWVKWNRVGTNGKYVYPFTARADFAPLAATGGASAMPGQVALVASLTTAATRGPAHAGRMYWPVPRYAVDSGLRISQANANSAVGEIANFLGAINAEIAPLAIRIYSKVGTGHQRLVTGVKVGRVLDTMRSRRGQLEEAYEVAEV